MSRSVWTPFVGAVMRNFVLGALWGSAAAILESFLYNDYFRVGLQNPSSLFELILNYTIYVGIGWVCVRLVLDALERRFRHTPRVERRREPSGAGARRGAASPTEAVLGAGLFVAVLANYIQKGPWGPIPFMSPATLAIGAVSIVMIVLLAWGVRRLAPRSMTTLRVVLAIWVVFGFAWYPLFGPFTGILRGEGTKANAGEAKNVLLIIVDTLRPDFLDSYGAEWGASPSSDRLAAGGAVCENNLGQSTWTLPCTASILTGLYPSSHGAVATGLPLSTTVTTLATVLQDAGYRTASFTENAYIRPEYGFGRGCDYFWTYWLPWVFGRTALYRVTGRLQLPTIEFTLKRPYVTIPEITRPEEVNWDARAATDAGLDWLQKGGDTPFFAYFHYMGPHSPYGPPEYLLDGDPPARRLTDYPRPMGGAFPLGEPGATATDQEIDEMKTLYAADILYVEHHLGRILDWLDETGKLSETVVVYTADHGEEFFEHGAWNHGSSAFDEVLRVPFIVYDESTVPAGTRTDAATRQIDLMPTVLDLLGLDCPKEVQGRSVRALLQGTPLDPEPVYVEVYPGQPKECDIFALIDGRYKVVNVSLGDRSAVLLYDRENDPGETNNFADAAPALLDSLLDQMIGWDTVARPPNSPLDIDPERLKRLRSLGYINQ